VPFGIKSIPLNSRQPVWGRLNGPVSISNGPVAMIPGQQLSHQCRLYEQGDLLAVRLLNWDEIIDGHDENYNWAQSGAVR